MSKFITKPILWEIPSTQLDVTLDLTEAENTIKNRLQSIAKKYTDTVFASSLAAEDSVITHIIAKYKLNIDIFTLDTKKLNIETYQLKSELEQFFDLTINSYFPNKNNAQNFEKEHGKTAMYNSLELRKSCCYIRKLEPLNRALKNTQAWITGQRREQSITRNTLPLEEYDNHHQLPKFNPIADWTEYMVWEYIKKHNIPYNKLYQKGYPSIGCEPCTKAVKQGDNLRSGRWWWEQANSKECGLHQSKT